MFALARSARPLRLLAAAAVTALALGAPPAFARHEIGAGGAHGDHQTSFQCPAGQELRGFRGRAGGWIDQLQVMCAPRRAGGGYADPVVQGPVFGGNGGADQSESCRNDEPLTRFAVLKTTDDRQVQVVKIGCGAKERYFGTTGLINGDTVLTGKTNQNVDCALYEEVLVGITINYGVHVNALGGICERATPAPPPPPPPPAPKPIKHTGRPRTPAPAPVVPSGPPIAVRQTVNGPWKMAFQGGGTYLFQITAQGQGIGPFGRDDLPMAISGYLSEIGGPANSAGPFGGPFDVGRQMILQYGLQNGKSGTCQLNYVTDGQHIVGTCSEGGTSHSVSGTRASAEDVAAAQPASPAAAAVEAAAAQRPAGAGEPAAAQRQAAAAAVAVAVLKAVDLYPAPGGNGDAIGSLDAGTAGVTLVEPCKGDWCHVRWADKDGWVYSGPDYNALGR